MILFETERLIARWLEPADVDAMVSVYGDAEAMRWVDDGKPIGASECADWIEVTHRNYEIRGYGMSALIERRSGMVVGFMGLVHPGGQPEAEIKYAFHRSWWGKGLATEAVCAMLAYGVEHHDLRNVIATIAPGNSASQRVLEKAGMRMTSDQANDDGTITRFLSWTSPPPVVSDAER